MGARVHRLLRSFFGAAQPLPDAEGGLLICRECGAAMVVPVAWREHDDASWWMRIRCGECGSSREVVIDDDRARRYERVLNRGVAELRQAVEALDRERMRRDSDVLRIALERDLIDAGDFAP
jgi:uncharacterized Zn finger protein